jgi:hypothetical protein
MVGTHRHVPAAPDSPCKVFLEAAREHALPHGAGTKPSHPIPTLTYWPDPEPVATFVRETLARGERLTETTRATVSPRANVTLPGSAPFIHLMESATAQSFFVRLDDIAMTTSVPVHAAVYRRALGGKPIPGTTPMHIPRMDGVGVVLQGRREDLPSSTRTRCESLAARIARTGAACRCPTFPQCLGGPYESGGFRDTDLFCPLRASELLVTAIDAEANAQAVTSGATGGTLMSPAE